MSVSAGSLTDRLSQEGIFSPNSSEQKRFENRLARFFQREYERCISERASVGGHCAAADSGPMMEETRALMDRHYDETLEFFMSFLDTRYRAYSMAYYGETPDAILGSDASLEEAQLEKFNLIAERAQIKGDERILNIGCGFGSLEQFLLERYPNAEIVGVTPSKVQVTYLRKRMNDPIDVLGSGRFKLIEGAFDQLPIEVMGERQFDLVISIAVFEQVLNMPAFMRRIASLLVPEGRTFHHFITSRTLVPRLLEPRSTRVGLYFPGGRVWPHAELKRHAENFVLLNSWVVNGLNYWRTLDEWHKRYWSNIRDLYDDVFSLKEIEHWNQYFSLCKAMFAPMEGTFYGNSHYLFRMRG